MTTKKYISFYVYRNKDMNGQDSDCTNNGISGKANQLYIEHPQGFIDEDKIKDPEAIMVLVVDDCMGAERRRLIPKHLHDKKAWTMFGGNYGHSSDARIIEVLGKHPVRIHDRVEN